MAYNREVLCVSINDEGNLFVAGTESGIRIFNMEPLVSKLNIDSSKVGSVAICKLLHRTNLIAFVGGGNRPKYADNTVLVWDAKNNEIALEFTFSSKVLNLVTRRDRIFVAERNKIHCFTFPEDPKKIFTIETGDNPNGICEVTPLTSASELQLLAYPGHRMGSVQLLDLSTTSSPGSIDPESIGASVSHSPTSISAHESEIACIALSRTGNLVATASRKGTLIRLYRTIDATSGRSATSYIPLSPEKVGQFRRGLDTATLYCLVFSPDSEYLIASSDKGTVHIFALNQLERKSTISAKLVTLVDVYSISKFALPAECACVCTFGADRRSVYAVCVDGAFHKYLLNKDGSCERDNYDNYLEVHDEADHIFQKEQR